MDAITQRAKILAYCEKHGSITNLEATLHLLIGSPTKRISEIRNSDKYTVTSVVERNDVTRWNRYYIKAKS